MRRWLDAAEVALLRECPLERLVNLWALVVADFKVPLDGMAALGHADRFYLLTNILGRKDAFDPWLYDRCREVERNPDGHLDLWAREHYKGEMLTTPIPTPSGWTPFGELKVGDTIFGPDGKPCLVIAQTPIFEDPECYEVEFDDGACAQVSSAHRWTVERKSRQRVPGTDKRLGRETVTIETADVFAHDHAPDNRLSVGGNHALSLPPANLPVPPYTLGAWLGDGHSGGGRLTVAYQDAGILDAIRAEGVAVVEQVSSNPNTGLYSLDAGTRGRKGTGLTARLRALGVLNDKHVPTLYLRASIGQRFKLLRGLMDSDGHCNERGTATFVNANERLVDGVHELAVSLGLKPAKYRYESASGYFWHVAFQAYQIDNPFLLARKASRAKPGFRKHTRRFIVACRRMPTVPMRCIQVDREDGLYLTGRLMVTTHNSTIITFAGSIQEIIRDPEITIGIFSHTKPTARKFLVQIKTELETNARLPLLFPDIFYSYPERDSVRWSEEKGIVVKRRSNPKEATVEGHGLVDGQPTGAHFRLRIYDDVVTLESVSTPEQVQKTTAAHALSDNLGAADPETGLSRAWHVGTRYSFADSYQDMLDRKMLIARIYAATDNGMPDGKPVFLNVAAWEAKKKTQPTNILAAQMLQNPAAGNEAMFRKEWLRFMDVRPATLNVYILCDPASSRKKGSDRTAIAVIGVAQGGTKWLLDGYHHRMRLSERYASIKAVRKVWQNTPGVQLVKVGYERYGSTSDLEYFEEQMQRERDVFEIAELAWPRDGPGAKVDRIQRLEPDFKQGRFLLAYRGENDTETANQAKVRQAGQGFRIFKPTRRVDELGNLYWLNKTLIDEFLVYPFSPHDDLLDACSRIYDIDPVEPVLIDQTALEPEYG